MARFKSVPQTDPRVNLSPMIDMVFILLIFFVVAAVFVEESGFEVVRPIPVPVSLEKPEPPLSFHIDGSNRVYSEGRQIALVNIRSKVSHYLSSGSSKAVVVETVPTASAGLMVRVLDEVRLGGLEVVSLSLDTR